ncbi:response regulator [Thiocystis violascens]|uniref:Response regulator with CheY-like receiver domain and winged-helix DNA-binding domain n=1 Tax=Thiocystis violascens (strain ATCC 17096 / DSM 198 / 6111) TaxID=765911 RepID=I3Y9M4_THIV6|nr:response regulator [Thiocystis violascens]AFL73692.1 response regulator with CheY-like receiver domain and winged-helix DNA-binding domain [Thiocystis violascens DSM 198]
MSDSTEHRVMIVDDDEISAAALEIALRSRFEIHTLYSGEAALLALEQIKPEVVLLDISMPGIDGYATCRQLRKRLPQEDQPAVIFVSVKDTLEDRLLAYESGGDDFIIKPAQPEEVLSKARAMVGLVAERKRLKVSADSARQMAMGFLTNLGETGTALQFLRNSQSCLEPLELARLAIATLREYGLAANVQLRPPGATLTFIESGSATPLEESVFAMVRDMGRIFQFRQRLIINYPHVSVLIKNLPIADPDRAGRLRDLLAIIAEGCETSMLALIRIAEIDARTRQLQQTGAAVQAAIESLHQQYQAQQSDTRIILHQMHDRFTHDLLFLGLTEPQEERMMQLLDASIEETLNLFSRGLDFGDQLAQLRRGIATGQ